jgi:hypothetical protein
VSHLEGALYFPLLLLGLAYAGTAIAGNAYAGRGEGSRAEHMRDLGFALLLVAAAYTLVLLIVAAVGYPDRFYDAILIFVVVAVFFGLLLFALFGIGEVLLGRFGRRR